MYIKTFIVYYIFIYADRITEIFIYALLCLRLAKYPKSTEICIYLFHVLEKTKLEQAHPTVAGGRPTYSSTSHIITVTVYDNRN